jgi:hypothetical protein
MMLWLALALAAVPAPARDPFVGTWRLNLSKSQLGASDRIVTDERTYDRYGASIMVGWTRNLDGREARGSYAAKCDGRPAILPGGAVLVCRYVAARMVEGELRDRNDPAYVYFRRTVSRDGKTLTITWYADARRTRAITKRVYDRAPE